jgi:hypothetical protein
MPNEQQGDDLQGAFIEPRTFHEPRPSRVRVEVLADRLRFHCKGQYREG